MVTSFTELLGIASIAPFMALVGDISLLEKEGILAQLYQASGLTSPTDFLFYTGLLVLLMLSVSSILSMYTIWKLSMYGAKVGTEISDRLYVYYMQQDWLFHSRSSSSHLIKQISTETLRVSDHIIQSLMNMNAKVMLSIFILIAIFTYDPLIAISALFLFVMAYILLYKVVQKRLKINGENISRVLSNRFRLMSEGFGGIKDILLLNRHHEFVSRFQESGGIFSYARGANIAISQVPRYFMELVTFGGVIALVLILLKFNKGDLGVVLPILAVYALAIFKLLPALQQIYSSTAQIKGNLAAFESIKGDLERSLKSQLITTKSNDMHQLTPEESTDVRLPLRQNIILNDITFAYPGSENPVLSNLNMTIPVNSVVGLVGESGSGKSTVIDLLLGLLTPQLGELRIDDININKDNKRTWQNNIGFVPQHIFLSEGTIIENIAFGVPEKDISLERVMRSIKLAHLTDLIRQLPNGLDTKVGERGVRLSGGQRQRIGIARSLYNEADVLIFDEATSALDGVTEKVIMDAVYDFSGQKTIIMIAHRLKTVQKCDIIYLMERGKITMQGSYDELVENSALFKNMTKHA